jgi:hypothetical protein
LPVAELAALALGATGTEGALPFGTEAEPEPGSEATVVPTFVAPLVEPEPVLSEVALAGESMPESVAPVATGGSEAAGDGPGVEGATSMVLVDATTPTGAADRSQRPSNCCTPRTRDRPGRPSLARKPFRGFCLKNIDSRSF